MSDLDRELEELVAEHAELIQWFRLAWLGRAVAHGRAHVVRCTSGFLCDRLTVMFDNGLVLRAKLRNPLWHPMKVVQRVVPSDDGSCIVVGTTTDGDRVICHGWSQSVEVER